MSNSYSSDSQEYDKSPSGGEGPSTRSKKRIKYSQKYKKDWENDEQFKGWIKQGKIDCEAICTVCNEIINIAHTGKTILLQHKESVFA